MMPHPCQQATSWTAAAVALGALLTAAIASAADPRPATSPASAATPATRPATSPATQPALGRPMPKAVPVDPKALTDQKIGDSIRRGVDWLLDKFDPKAHALKPNVVDSKGDPSYAGGAN